MRLFRFLLFTTILFATIGCSSLNDKPKVITIKRSVADDATYALLSAIEKINAGEFDVLEFERGEYHFYPDRAFEKYCFTSNHGDYLSRIAFYLDGIEGLTIDGNDSKFIFHNRIYPFYITNTDDITLRNFSIDYAERFCSEPIVVANDTKSHTFDIEIPQGEQYEIRNGDLYFVAPDYGYTIGQTILYDPKRESVAYNTEIYTPITQFKPIKSPAQFINKYPIDSNDPYQKVRGKEYAIKAEEIAPRVIRISGHRNELPPVGLVLSCKGEQGINRLAPAIKVENSVDFIAEGVTIYHSSGMGFLHENSENITLDRCRVIPAKGYMVSATADASHFAGCRGNILITGCTFRNQLDDAVNIHGAYQPIVSIIDEHTVGVRMGHFQQLGFILGREGDSIGIVRIADSFHAYETLTIESVRVINSRYNEITFKEPLPKNLSVGDLTENLSAYPTVEISENYFGGNRARGVLISTNMGTIIRDNTFSTEMEAILFPVENSHWYESGSAENVLIEGNRFEDSNFGGKNRGVICFRTDADLNNIAFANITIKDNTFSQFDNLILEASNIDGLSFTGNKIINSETYEQLFPENPVITLKYCQNVEFLNNDYQGKATQMIKMLDDSNPITFK